MFSGKLWFRTKLMNWLLNRMTTTNGVRVETKEMSGGKQSVIAWMRLARVYHKIDRRSAEAFREAGLSTAQFDVLAQVGAREGCTQQELADRLLVTKGNVCQLLDKLERRGWIERRPLARGRGNQLYLTEDGQRIRSATVPAQEQRVAEWLSVLSEEECEQLGLLLRKLDRSLD
jgi:DNA-binding MarR family transcriptional regulator